ncbi:CPBP family intramembrane glutamic endopeptidase [Actinomadura chibensis]|uniref:CAAX protease family protein n=1 Tax=Actinomadura chibensis TaxID=392828 RepID=A0A5D0NI62_9ACTN|nr:CPBP family intramembrane glutamic endopeptidase [Actinomadura chibensis]TYB43881.1 CAAX protease family protein [Actinomadura chibensis]
MTKSLFLRGAGVLAVLFGPHFATALNAFAELAGTDTDIGWPGLPGPVNVSAVSLTAAGIWLLIRARRCSQGGAVWCAAALAVAGAVLLPLVGQAADTAATVLLTGAGAWLCSSIARDAGMPLWRGRLPSEIAGRWDTDAVAACAVVLAGHSAAMILDPWFARLGPAVTDQAAQADVTGLHNQVLFAVQALAAGVREEIPLLALPVALMLGTRRPAWQILLTVCVLRALPHAYLGAAALSSVAFAAAAWWMYRATRRVGPIIVGHTLFNAIAMFGGPAGYAALLTAPALACVLLANAPNAAPRWFRRWIRGSRDGSRVEPSPCLAEGAPRSPASSPTSRAALSEPRNGHEQQ